MTDQEAQRIAVLDGLRAMAIILVLMRHAIRPFWFDYDTPFFAVGGLDFGALFINGWAGVDLFFVLSGYLITSHLLGRYFDPAKRSMDLKTYAKRRFLRIAPAYYAALTIAVLGLFPFYPYPSSYENIGWRYVYHLLFLQDYLPSDINIVFWSLAIEIKFYLLAPFALMGLLRLKRPGARLAALGAALLAMPLLRMLTLGDYEGGDSYSAYFFQIRSAFHLALDGLLAGMLCAAAWREEKLRALICRKPVAEFLFWGGIILFFTLVLFPGPPIDRSVSGFDMVWLPFLISIGFAMMLLGLMGGSAAGLLFGWRGWYPVALVSYSLYLFHLPMVYPAYVITDALFGIKTHSPQVTLLLFLPFFIALSAAAASLSYFFIERPFLSKR